MRMRCSSAVSVARLGVSGLPGCGPSQWEAAERSAACAGDTDVLEFLLHLRFPQAPGVSRLRSPLRPAQRLCRIPIRLIVRPVTTSSVCASSPTSTAKILPLQTAMRRRSSNEPLLVGTAENPPCAAAWRAPRRRRGRHDRGRGAVHQKGSQRIAAKLDHPAATSVDLFKQRSKLVINDDACSRRPAAQLWRAARRAW